nr:helicase associated domain-containing protein [Streptomyces sp. TLI_235]
MEDQQRALAPNARHHASAILQAVKLRAFNPRAVEWQRMHGLATRCHIEHGHLDPTDKAKHAELLSWLARQRHLSGQGLLDAARVSELGALGIIWSKNANAWERGYAYARAFHQRHGHLAIPATAKLDDYAVGAWMRRQRKAGSLTKGQTAELDALDELWPLEPLLPPPARLPRRRRHSGRRGEPQRPRRRPTFRHGAWLRITVRRCLRRGTSLGEMGRGSGSPGWLRSLLSFDSSTGCRARAFALLSA